MLKPGDLAPDFVLPDHAGRDVRLSEYEGRKVVLWFYPKADTQTCAAEGLAFAQHYDEFQRSNVAILGVSLDPLAENAAFARRHALPFPLLSDLDRVMTTEYGAVTSPDDAYTKRITYVIDEDGRVVRSFVRVKPDGHVEEVLETVKKLP